MQQKQLCCFHHLPPFIRLVCVCLCPFSFFMFLLFLLLKAIGLASSLAAIAKEQQKEERKSKKRQKEAKKRKRNEKARKKEHSRLCFLDLPLIFVSLSFFSMSFGLRPPGSSSRFSRLPPALFARPVFRALFSGYLRRHNRARAPAYPPFNLRARRGNDRTDKLRPEAEKKKTSRRTRRTKTKWSYIVQVAGTAAVTVAGRAGGGGGGGQVRACVVLGVWPCCRQHHAPCN